jgi:hypothetical protein
MAAAAMGVTWVKTSGVVSLQPGIFALEAWILPLQTRILAVKTRILVLLHSGIFTSSGWQPRVLSWWHPWIRCTSISLVRLVWCVVPLIRGQRRLLSGHLLGS